MGHAVGESGGEGRCGWSEGKADAQRLRGRGGVKTGGRLPGCVAQHAGRRARARNTSEGSSTLSPTSLWAKVVEAAVGELSEAARVRARSPQVYTAIKKTF